MRKYGLIIISVLGVIFYFGFAFPFWRTFLTNNGTAIHHLAGKEYLTANGEQIKWWKGKGGFIDYSNPEAMKWWRGLQQTVFDYGIDGWKLDGTATLNFK